MGLKSFLKQQGFIDDGPSDKNRITPSNGGAVKSNQDIPVYFPVDSPPESAGASTADTSGQEDPSFVEPLQQKSSNKERLDPSFIKFFEDALTKENLPGPDYFEFRQLLLKTQQKMANKGGAAPEVVLQAVLMSLEAQDVQPAKLIETARQYKDILKQKNDEFIKGAENEKNNQLAKRQAVLQEHSSNIQKIQDQLQQLDLQKKQLEESLTKEKTQLDVSKTLGKEGIEKIERAERLISLAHNYMQSNIDADIKRLQSV